MLLTKAQGRRGLFLLAPRLGEVPECFRRVAVSADFHAALLYGLQRFRGAVYLADGALSAEQLTTDGRHRQPADMRSWHLVMTDTDRVLATTRLMPYRNQVRFGELGVRHSALACSDVWGSRLQWAVEQEIQMAARLGYRFGEVGGWALAPEIRGSMEALRMALGTYALGQALGGFVTVSTATHRHASAMILRRIGGAPLRWDGHAMPVYYDPTYGCDMEILRFDSEKPNAKYKEQVELLRASFIDVPVVARLDDSFEAEFEPSSFNYQHERPTAPAEEWAPVEELVME
jgi:hypothetical protein